RGVRIRTTEITRADGGSSHADLALLAGVQLASFLVEDDDLDSGAGATACADTRIVDGDPTVVLGLKDGDSTGHLGESKVLNKAGAEPLEGFGLVGGKHRSPGIDDPVKGVILGPSTGRITRGDAVEDRRHGEGVRDPVGVDSRPQ